MIKVFVKESKLNVVDDKNNLVGFDTKDNCCAHGGWFISREKITKDFESHEGKNTEDLNDYSFDTAFFEQPNLTEEEGGLAIFKMTADDKPDLYLHLFNMHNGYYSKGFESSFGREGSL